MNDESTTRPIQGWLKTMLVISLHQEPYVALRRLPPAVYYRSSPRISSLRSTLLTCVTHSSCIL